MTPLADTPNELRQIIDDADAQVLIVQFGLLDELRKLSARTDVPKARMNVVFYENCPTHWVAAMYHMGHPVAAENGYAVTCFPKSGYSRTQFLDVFRASVGALPYFVEGRKMQPPQN